MYGGCLFKHYLCSFPFTLSEIICYQGIYLLGVYFVGVLRESEYKNVVINALILKLKFLKLNLPVHKL